MQDIYLDHFLEAHKAHAPDALAELTAGRKQTHWMWFIFPIVQGLGKSDTAQYYAIESIDEASAFINHPYLGNNYQNCLEAILSHKDRTSETIFSSKIDSWKFRSSLTLFEMLPTDESKKENIQRCLKKFYNDEKCGKTIDFLQHR